MLRGTLALPLLFLALAIAAGCSPSAADDDLDDAASAPADAALDAAVSASGPDAAAMSNDAALGNGGDAGSSGDASDVGDAGDAGDAAATGALICTSGVYWTSGNMGDPEMNPGGDCLGCHKNNAAAPVFTLAGTVYPTLHELTTCDGTPRAKVVIVDRNAKTFTLETNDAGNFACGAVPVDDFAPCVGLAFPVSVQISVGADAGPVVTGQTAGNCNACHSPRGANGAPGRITF